MAPKLLRPESPVDPRRGAGLGTLGVLLETGLSPELLKTSSSQKRPSNISKSLCDLLYNDVMTLPVLMRMRSTKLSVVCFGLCFDHNTHKFSSCVHILSYYGGNINNNYCSKIIKKGQQKNKFYYD